MFLRSKEKGQCNHKILEMYKRSRRSEIDSGINIQHIHEKEYNEVISQQVP